MSTTTNVSTDAPIDTSKNNDLVVPSADDEPAEIDTNQPEAEENITAGMEDSISKLFTTTNILILIGFLGIYMGVSYYRSRGQSVPTADNTGRGISMIVDIVFFMVLGLVAYNMISSEATNKDGNITGKFINTFTEFVNTPSSVITSMFMLIGLYLVVYIFGIPMGKENKPISVSTMEAIAWSLLITVLIVDVLKYLFGISFDEVFEKIKAYFRGESAAESNVIEKEDGEACESKEEEKTAEPEGEVFNVSNNLYTYDDAQAICKSYNAKLASYEQVEAAYNNGAEWCNYGWSEGQMALFPTQKETWDTLQKLDEGVCEKGKKKGNNCGRPGINGGYIANPYVKFGVNCYGKKPDATKKDLKLMETKKDQVYPKTPSEQKLEEKVEFWKQNKDKYLQLNSYNTKKWTEKIQPVTDSVNANQQT
jgi:hypothetical protein